MFNKGHVRNSVDELSILNYLNMNPWPPKAPKILPIFWSPPPHGWIKVNIDASVIDNQTRCGGVFRNSHGIFVGGFTYGFACNHTFSAELKAVILVIMTAMNGGWDRIWLESDSTNVVNTIVSKNKRVSYFLFHEWKRMPK